jgi:hypothetical protein
VEKFASPAASWSIYSATQITILPGSCPSIVTYTHPHHPLTQIDSGMANTTSPRTKSSRTAEQRNEQAPPAPGAGGLALLEMPMKPVTR